MTEKYDGVSAGDDLTDDTSSSVFPFLTNLNDKTPTDVISSIDESSAPVEPEVNPPTIPLDVQDPMTRQIADGIKLALKELRPFLKELMIEVQQTMDMQHESEREPDVEYDRRFHVFKFIAQASGFVVTFVLLTIAYALFTGNFGAAIVGVVLISGAVTFGARFINSRQAIIEDEIKRIKFKRWSRVALVALSLGLGLVFIVVEELVGISSYWSVAYLLVGIALLYVSLRFYYMWSRLHIVRDGGVLRAQRPGKDIFFLPELNRELLLNNVNDCNYAQSWLEEKLGMYRILIRLDADMPDPRQSKEDKESYKNAMFWTNLKYIVDGPQLRKAIRQGSLQRRG